jgi:hypothetical protein
MYWSDRVVYKILASYFPPHINVRHYVRLGKQALGWLAGLFQRNHLIDFVAQDYSNISKGDTNTATRGLLFSLQYRS